MTFGRLMNILSFKSPVTLDEAKEVLSLVNKSAVCFGNALTVHCLFKNIHENKLQMVILKELLESSEMTEFRDKYMHFFENADKFELS